MAQVILLTDTVLWGEIGNSRYMGAYAIAQASRQAGFGTLVIDYFTRHPDFFSYLEQFLTPDTLTVAVSSTFLAPFRSVLDGKKQRSEGLSQYYKGDLWFEDPSELVAWTCRLKELLHRKSPKAVLVLGGVKSQFALWRQETYQAFDYVVLGAADLSFPNLVRKVSVGEVPDFEWTQGVRVLNNRADLENKNCPQMVWTKQDAVLKQESLPLEVARGCVFNCKFCHYDKKESFKKDLSLLRDELIRNYENFGTTTYHFCDDCFNDHPKKVEALCQLFLSLPFQIEWVAYARVDVAVKFPETIDLMIRAGAKGLYWGLESFHPIVARNAGKGTPPEKVQKFLLEFHEKYSGQCFVEGSFITGLPGETNESLEETLSWLCEHPVIDFLTVGSLGLMPYVSNFDKKIFDYADYSRNPEKYGFKKVTFKPNYWEHETMNSHEAIAWAEKMMSTYRNRKPPGFIRTIWQYPHFKTLGYSSSEIFQMRNSTESFSILAQKTANRFSEFLKEYWEQLARSSSPESHSGDQWKDLECPTHS